MPVCPKCKSPEVIHKDRRMQEATAAARELGPFALLHALHGYPLRLLAVAGYWAYSKLRHLVGKRWKCQNATCGHTFS
jgi:hypothetical protein